MAGFSKSGYKRQYGKKAYKSFKRAGKRAASSGMFTQMSSYTPVSRYRKGLGPPAALYSRGGGQGTELKSIDTNSVGYIGKLSTTGTVQDVDLPIQGSSFYNRIANRSRGVSLEIKGMIYVTGLNTHVISETYARILVVYDRQTNGSNPLLSDILANYDQGGTATTSMLSSTNPTNKDRFMILRDRKVVLPPMGIGGITPPAATALAPTNIITDLNVASGKGFNYYEFIKLNNLETHYKASAGGIGDVATGSFYVVCISNDPFPAEPAWEFLWVARYKYLD